MLVIEREIRTKTEPIVIRESLDDQKLKLRKPENANKSLKKRLGLGMGLGVQLISDRIFVTSSILSHLNFDLDIL